MPYHDEGEFFCRRPDPTCIFNNGVDCSSFFKDAGAMFEVTHEKCKNCGWNPEVSQKRLGQIKTPVEEKKPEDKSKENKALRQAVESLSTSLESELQINKSLRKTLDEKNKEIVRLRIELGKEKKKSE